MTERNYTTLCRLYPYKNRKGETVDYSLFETNPIDENYHFDYQKNSEICDWIVEHSKILIPEIHTISY